MIAKGRGAPSESFFTKIYTFFKSHLLSRDNVVASYNML